MKYSFALVFGLSLLFSSTVFAVHITKRIPSNVEACRKEKFYYSYDSSEDCENAGLQQKFQDKYAKPPKCLPAKNEAGKHSVCTASETYEIGACKEHRKVRKGEAPFYAFATPTECKASAKPPHKKKRSSHSSHT